MIKKNLIYLGVCPIGKFVFSNEDAIIQKNRIFEKLKKWKIKYISLDGILPDGLVKDQSQVDLVVNYFKKEKIDALFIPHCNFGTEGAAGIISKKLHLPTLLWGPRDEAPLADGTRLRDTLCGMLATSKVLYKLKVPFTYIENCRIDDIQFKNGIDLFIGSASVVKAMNNMKIGQIGVRIDFFWSTIINESELLDKFGIQIIPIDMVEFINKIKNRSKKDRTKYEKELLEIKKWLTIEGLSSDEPLFNSLAYRDELIQLAVEKDLDAISIQSFSSIQNELGGATNMAESLANDKGIPIIDESDIHGAISSILIEAAGSTNELSFMPDITIRHPENDNAVLLWHATAPLSLRDKNSKIKLAPPWILKGLPASSLHFKLKDGPLTICRFDGDDGKYVLGIGEGHTVSGPYTQEFYTWMEVNNWEKWEKKLIEGPFIHHCSAIYDRRADILEEACKYIPEIISVRFDK